MEGRTRNLVWHPREYGASVINSMRGMIWVNSRSKRIASWGIFDGNGRNGTPSVAYAERKGCAGPQSLTDGWVSEEERKVIAEQAVRTVRQE